MHSNADCNIVNACFVHQGEPTVSTFSPYSLYTLSSMMMKRRWPTSCDGSAASWLGKDPGTTPLSKAYRQHRCGV
jgi:hypothetical protein